MSGLAGFFNCKPSQYKRDARFQILTDMGTQLARRGPDDEQTYDDGCLSFVFRRLSIIDLKGGRQPIWNEDHSIFVAVSGEIYNHAELHAQLRKKHSFQTKSDAEIVLHLFEEKGAEMLRLLNGSFAIAIWNARDKHLFLARDRFGIKPLYYYHRGSQFIFASELKALLVHPDCPKELDWHALTQPAEISLPQPTPPATYIKAVSHLPGGSYLIFDRDNAVKPQTYWAVENFFTSDKSPGNRTPDDFMYEYSALAVDSVKKRLMGDTPPGVLLSGGVDSSFITAVASKSMGRNLHCFHVLERAMYLSGDSTLAENITRRLKVPFHPVLFDVKDLLDQLGFSLSHFEYFVWFMDSPRWKMEWFLKHEVHRYAKTILPELKVLLCGLGADEFSGGFSNARGNNPDWQSFLDKDVRTHLSHINRIKAGISRNMLPYISADYKPAGQLENYSVFQCEMRNRANNLLQSISLWHVDRTAASQGIEARLPFLDHRLIELLASVPPKFHAELFWDKRIEREAARKWLTHESAQKPKTPFFRRGTSASLSILSHEILLRIFPEFCEKYLKSPGGIFSKSALTGLFDQIKTKNTQGQEETILYNCMAIAVFNDLTQKLPKRKQITYMDCPSPLKEAPMVPRKWDLPDPPLTLKDTPRPVWNDKEKPILAPGIQVLCPISQVNASDKKTIHILQDGMLTYELPLDSGTAWISKLLTFLSGQIRHTSPMTVIQLSRQLTISKSELKRVLSLCYDKKWVIKLD